MRWIIRERAYLAIQDHFSCIALSSLVLYKERRQKRTQTYWSTGWSFRSIYWIKATTYRPKLCQSTDSSVWESTAGSERWHFKDMQTYVYLCRIKCINWFSGSPDWFLAIKVVQGQKTVCEGWQKPLVFSQLTKVCFYVNWFRTTKCGKKLLAIRDNLLSCEEDAPILLGPRFPLVLSLLAQVHIVFPFH